MQDLWKTSISNLVDNLPEEIHKFKCKDCECFLEYETVKDSSIKYKSLSCYKSYLHKIDELKEIQEHIYVFS